MHFTGLKIVGFKSFVDPIEAPILEGLTGIVGPNGCGKSNLLEALRWVMGATSARAMRGGEMDDLIFAGSAERPAREMAEVTLQLDNRDRRAPAEFNTEDTLEIRRTLRRGAGSSYRINGRAVRAKDIQLLFADASTGANSPALVRQGQISELIGAKPQNRRRILEEAAGIGGLAARRHEAELKLTAAEDNLNRLGEIMAEVERQANALKRQAGKARRYRALSEEITALEARLAAARWRAALLETVAARDALAIGKEAEQAAISALARASAAELTARSRIDPLRAAEAEAAGRLGAAKLQLARLEAERDAAREAVQRLARDIDRLTSDAAREAAQREEAATRVQRTRDALDSLPAEDPAQRKQDEADLAAAVEYAMETLQQVEADAEQTRARLHQADALAQAARAALKREDDRRNMLEVQLKKVRADVAALGNADKFQSAFEAARNASAEAERKSQTAQTAAAEANRAMDAARAEETRLTPPLVAAERRVREMEAELKGLERLLVKAETTGAAPVLASVRPGALDRAFAAALDADIEAPADENAPVHWTLRHGRSAQPLPQGATPLCDLISAPAVLRARLSQVGLVRREVGEQLQPMLKPGQRLVSAEGDLWRWDGFVRRSGAPLPAAEKLTQHRRHQKIFSDLRSAQADLDAAAKARHTASAVLTAAETTAMERRRQLPEAMRQASAAKEALLRAEQDVERLSLRSASMKDQDRRLAADLAQAEAALSAAREALAGAPTEGDRDAFSTLAETVKAAREAERRAAGKLETFVRDHERADAMRVALIRDRDEWSARAAEAHGRAAALDSDLANVRTAYEAAAVQPEALQARLDATAESAAAAEAARRQAADTLAEFEAELRQAEIAARAARDQSASAREQLARSEARLEAAIRREAEIAETARAAFGRELDDLETLVRNAEANALAGADADDPAVLDYAQADPAALDARLLQLRRDRDGLGAVNMEADEQLAEISGRMGLQAAERDDLTAAIAKLREGVHALNQEGRQRLLDAYAAVNAHFRSLFVTLFDGGEAELRLTESEDPLDAGLEIFASPPGKRLGQLSLMSGGEQALTATALIFAVFLTRPAPLCVLDEVDAPLDDANVDRFCRMLDAMRRQTDTRFIVITHNAVTMSRMDRLFGVTMQERGVSRLVSVDLEAAERLAAA